MPAPHHRWEPPDELFRELAEQMHHGAAAADPDTGVFLWVNDHFCRTLGYSPPELLSRTWMAITVEEDVGADLAAVDEVKAGVRTSYAMSKRYRHRRGFPVPVWIEVRRFPEIGDTITVFVVTVSPEGASPEAVIALQHDAKKATDAVNTMATTVGALSVKVDALSAEFVKEKTLERRFKKWWPILLAAMGGFGTLIGFAAKAYLGK